MRYHVKPVRKCHGCLLNLGDHCWLFAYPRGQWRGDKRCRVFENIDFYEAFKLWKKQPDVKDRKTLRRESCRQRRACAGGEGADWVRERGLL